MSLQTTYSKKLEAGRLQPVPLKAFIKEALGNMKKIAVINQKGGVGKSSSAAAIGKGLSLKGYRVLFIDLDAQGNLSFIMGAKTGADKKIRLLEKPETSKELIQKTEQGDIIANSLSMAGADQLITETGKEFKLREALENLEGLYDYVIIDTPPALGILTVNALTACDEAIIPAQADIFSLQGIEQLSNTIDVVKKYTNSALKVAGIVLTRYNGRAVISRDIAEATEATAAKLHTKLYNTKIRECTAIKEAQARRQDIYSYAPRSNAAKDYEALVEEIIGK